LERRSSRSHRQALPAEALGKSLRVFRLGKAEHHEVGVIATREYVSGVADRTPAVQNITSRFTAWRTFFGRERRVMRFAFAAGHLRIAIDLFSDT
jgi:hypothetical protein